VTEITREEIDAKIDAKMVGLSGKIDLLAQEVRHGFQQQGAQIAALDIQVAAMDKRIKNSQTTIIATIVATMIGAVLAVIGIIYASQSIVYASQANMLSAFQAGRTISTSPAP
jgi:hypothetical protein